MKLLKQLSFTLLFIAMSVFTFGQDKIILNDERIINCDITSIKKDTIYYNFNYKNSTSKTYIQRNLVKDFILKKLESLKSNLDSASNYTFLLEDKTSVTGKIKLIQKSIVNLIDTNSQAIELKGEQIVSYSQSANKNMHEVILNDGTELIGKIISRSETGIKFESKSLGILSLSYSDISKINEISEATVVKGKYWFPNPNETRYLFGPSALNLKKGEGYYQNSYVLINMINVGITDYISIGAGGELISTFSGSPTLFITPKIGFPVAKKIHIGAGVLAGVFGGEATAGILYGVGTLGGKEHNLTVGVGFGFIDNEISNNQVLTLSGMTRVGRKVSLVTENWFLPTGDEYYEILSYGIRLFGKRMSFDLAFLNNRDIVESIPIGVPYVDVVIKF